MSDDLAAGNPIRMKTLSSGMNACVLLVTNASKQTLLLSTAIEVEFR